MNLRYTHILLSMVLISSILLVTEAQAQVAMRTNFVEVTVAECGAYGADLPVPGGFHPNTFDGRLSIVADPGMNGWNDAIDPVPYCGDYFIPGSVVEGFQIKVDTYPVRVNGNRGIGYCTGNDVAKTFQGFYNYSPALAKVAVWEGTDTLLGMDVSQKSVIFDGELFMITWTEICNNSGTDWDTLYYGRNADPDPEQYWGGGFATQFKIFEQPPVSAGAYMGIRGTSAGCILGLLSKDSRARVSYGGFFDTDPEDYWKGQTLYSNSGGTTADIAGQLSFRETNLDDGECTCLAMAHTFSVSAAGRAAKLTTLPCDIIPEPGAPLDPRLADLLAPQADAVAPVALALSPNPASSMTALRVQGGGSGHVSLYDLTGRRIQRNVASDLSEVAIDVSELSSGIYLIVVDRDGERLTQRLSVD